VRGQVDNEAAESPEEEKMGSDQAKDKGREGASKGVSVAIAQEAVKQPSRRGEQA